MKRDYRSLLFSAAGTMPMSALLLFFAPTVVSAQTASTTAPTTTGSATTTVTQNVADTPQTGQSSAPSATATTTTPAPANLASPSPQPNPTSTNSLQTTSVGGASIAPAPTQAASQVLPPGGYPQYFYPTAQQYPTAYPVQYPVQYPAVPVQGANPGGLTVQVTTQIGIPNQGGYPIVGGPGQAPIMPGQGVYPVVQGSYPAVSNPGGFVYGYPGVYNPTPIPSMPSQPVLNGGYVEANMNPALLPLAAQALWQQIAANPSQVNAQNLNVLQQLVRDNPNFVPGYIQLAQALINSNRTQDAISTLERGTTLYPNQPELARSLIIALGNSNRWTEAAMAARQFAIRNPNSALVSEFTKLADESNRLAQASSNSAQPARNSVMGNLLTAGLGYLLSGRISSPVTSSPIGGIQTPWSGSSITNQAVQELLNRVQLLNDADINSYVNDIGRKLGQASGRSNFEFYVVQDRDSGAIALPNGKIFVSAGSIANTNSETELAALIARQMGHSVLSHPDQVIRRGNLTGTIARLLPTVGGLVSPRVREFNNSTVGTLVSGLMGNLSSNLFRPSYSSRMVNDANATATKLLEKAGYGQGSLINISTGGDRHAQMKTKVQQLLGTSAPWWSLGR